MVVAFPGHTQLFYIGAQQCVICDIFLKKIVCVLMESFPLDFELKKVLPPPPPLGNFADISYLEENFKPHLLRDVCTLCSGALVCDSLLHMLLYQTKEKIKMNV